MDLREEYSFVRGDSLEIYEVEAQRWRRIWGLWGRSNSSKVYLPVFSIGNELHIRFHSYFREDFKEYKEVTSFRGFRIRTELGPGKKNLCLHFIVHLFIFVNCRIVI